MYKNNLWNKIFHHKSVENLKSRKEEIEFTLSKDYFNNIEDAENLINLMDIHKELWNQGYQSGNIGPDPYGMFRTDNISDMTSDQVYLGGIWGLNTNNIPYWENHINDEYGANGFGIAEDMNLYFVILNQYRNHLLSNYKRIKHLLELELSDLKALGY